MDITKMLSESKEQSFLIYFLLTRILGHRELEYGHDDAKKTKIGTIVHDVTHEEIDYCTNWKAVSYKNEVIYKYGNIMVMKVLERRVAR